MPKFFLEFRSCTSPQGTLQTVLTHALGSEQEAEDRQGAELALKQHRDATSKLQAEQDQESQVSTDAKAHIAS